MQLDYSWDDPEKAYHLVKDFSPVKVSALTAAAQRTVPYELVPKFSLPQSKQYLVR